MITEKDLEAEFTRETGKYRRSPHLNKDQFIGTSNPTEFNGWCIEKLLEYKNKEDEKDI